MPTTDLSAHDVLCAAKAYLLNKGWKQKGYGIDGEPRCVLGALDSAARGDFETGSPAAKAGALLMDIIDSSSLYVWNDHPQRTLDDVIALLDRAILATAPQETETPVEALA